MDLKEQFENHLQKIIYFVCLIIIRSMTNLINQNFSRRIIEMCVFNHPSGDSSADVMLENHLFKPYEIYFAFMLTGNKLTQNNSGSKEDLLEILGRFYRIEVRADEVTWKENNQAALGILAEETTH